MRGAAALGISSLAALALAACGSSGGTKTVTVARTTTTTTTMATTLTDRRSLCERQEFLQRLPLCI
jgi:hypothetical protein